MLLDFAWWLLKWAFIGIVMFGIINGLTDMVVNAAHALT